MEDNENLPPMTAQGRYIHNLIKNLSPEEIADLVANPPGNRSSSMGCDGIHALVTDYGPEHVKTAWLDKLADAAGVARDPEWPINWATPIAKMLGLEVKKAAEPATATAKKAKDAEVSSLDEARQAA